MVFIIIYIILMLIMMIFFIDWFLKILLISLIGTIIYLIHYFIKKNKYRKEYDSLIQKYHVALNEFSKKHIAYSYYNNFNFVLLLENNQLKLLKIPKEYKRYLTKFKPKIPKDINIYIYDINDIRYFKVEGSVRNEQYITGNISGGGSSLKGAIVGGMIYGDTGAIIGSRKKINGSLNTEYKKVDDRRIDIIFNNYEPISVNYNCYEYLLQYIPSKEYEVYIDNMKSYGRYNN